MNVLRTKVYLGDAVYADCDGYYVILTTEDGVSVNNQIMLEPEVFSELIRYYAKLTGANHAKESDEHATEGEAKVGGNGAEQAEQQGDQAPD